MKLEINGVILTDVSVQEAGQLILMKGIFEKEELKKTKEVGKRKYAKRKGHHKIKWNKESDSILMDVIAGTTTLRKAQRLLRPHTDSSIGNRLWRIKKQLNS